MPSEQRVTCDYCGRDLTTTGNMVDYRLALLNQAITSEGGVATAMMIYPPLKGDAYFCSLAHLKAWLAVPAVPEPAAKIGAAS